MRRKIKNRQNNLKEVFMLTIKKKNVHAILTWIQILQLKWEPRPDPQPWSQQRYLWYTFISLKVLSSEMDQAESRLIR